VRRGKYRTQWLALAGLAIAVSIPSPCLAFNGPFHPVPRPPARAFQARPAQAPRQEARPHPGGHAGDWLRRYKDLPPVEQDRALQNDPVFRRLPPAQQQALRQRLRHFSSLPPRQQARILKHMEAVEHMTPEQKQQLRQILGQIKRLPPVRQRAVGMAIRDLSAMPPAQREQIIDSPRFRSMFSDQEREMMRGATRLPLDPGDGGETGP
jgi:hypothetical protein